MSIKNKLFILFIALSLLTISLIGCGKKTSSSASSSGELEGEITFWHSFTQGQRLDVIQKVADQFMKDNPKVKIKIETFSWADFYTKWTTGLASGNVPDMSTALPMQVVEMMDAGAIIPIDDLIDDIGRDKFSLMTNDVILLSAKVQQDGSLFPEYPDNALNTENSEYLETFEGRNGVISLNGSAEGITSRDCRAFFSTTDKFGFGITQKASFQTWMYIDEWKEGAEIISNKKDDENYISVKLGKESDKELIVDFCGTIATIKNKLETKKWQYLGVYFKPDNRALSDRFSNPIYIGFGNIENGEVVANVYNKLSKDFPVEVTGNDVTTSYLPLFDTGTMTIGKNFKGKFDEMQIWGSDRSGSIKNDATSPYKLNIGSWDNIFLTAYWKFDEKDNLGKDSQSYIGMIDFIKDYYKNHTGFKIRIGIIYPDGDKWKNSVLKKAKMH